MIKINNISKQYQLKNKEVFHAVDNVTLEINDGEIVGIVGFSGAGKSTLVRLLNGLIKPDHGEVLIDDIDITKISKKELNLLRHNIGMVFQNFNLISSLTIKDNISLALKIAEFSNDKELIENRALEVLTLVGLVDKVDEYPKNLSGGQKQRVAIARAIANNPKYLLCDEITSALDNKTAFEIVELLKNISEDNNITIVFISHQLDIVRALCNRVIVMESGKVVEDNLTQNIFLEPKASATKSLIGTTIDTSQYKNKYLLKYSESASEKTILSDAILKYGVIVNILEAQTMNVNNLIIGFMVVDIIGDNKEKLIKYLNENKVEVNII